jgi:PleD family two-component response regulator
MGSIASASFAVAAMSAVALSILHPLDATAMTATVRDITERKESERRLAMERDELQGLAFKDGLTGLSNRRCLDRQLELLS